MEQIIVGTTMAREPKYYLDEMPTQGYAAKHLTKQQFGQRLYSLMMAKGWNQSELARQADLPRDSISTYVRGRTFPTPKSLNALAKALGVTATDLLPNVVESALDEEMPSVEMRVSTTAPDRAWLRVNRMVMMSTATKIIEMLNEDTAGGETSDTERSR